MKSLLAFELNKIFRQKSIYVVFIALLGLTLISVNDLYIDYTEYYKGWEGELTEEKYNRAVVEHTKLMNELENAVVDEVISWTQMQSRTYGVLEEISQIHSLNEQYKMSVNSLKASLVLLEKQTFEYREQALFLRMLENVEVNSLYYHRAPAEMIEFVHIFGTLLSGTLILIGLSPIFSNEYMTGMDQLQLSSRHGRRLGVRAKIAASIIYTSVVIVVWELFNFAQRIIVYGKGGWSSPLQQLFEYRNSPYDYDLLTYMLVQLGMHMLGAFGFALLVLLVSALCRHTLLSILISGSIFALPIAITVFFDLELGKYEKILEFTYTNVMRVRGLFDQFEVINLFGQPVLYPFVAITVMAALSVAAVTLLFYTMKRREVV